MHYKLYIVDKYIGDTCTCKYVHVLHVHLQKSLIYIAEMVHTVTNVNLQCQSSTNGTKD